LRRRGKSTCLVVPTLLAWPHSALILDVKGEPWHLTAGYRPRTLGHRCLRLDLACADGTAARYNPLLAVPRGAEDVKHAQSIADTLVDPDGRDQARTFWDQSAHTLLTALILQVVYIGDEPTLPSVPCTLGPARPGRIEPRCALIDADPYGVARRWRDLKRGEKARVEG
jgi:type IV secretion system protein VirD4